MDPVEAKQHFYSLIPEEPLVGISNVAQNMAERRMYYDRIGYPQFNTFALSYHFVTTTIEDKVEKQLTLGMNTFKQPQVLDTAIGVFDHKFAIPFRQQIDGQPLPVHWNVPMNHELMRSADRGIQAVIGYVCHIASRDLPETVYQTAHSGLFSPKEMRDYVKHDYRKIDESLAEAARKLTPRLIETQNPKTRDALLRLAMSGIVLGRKVARLDYKRLEHARSEDHRESIMQSLDYRAAKLATFILEKSHSYYGSKQHPASGDNPHGILGSAA